MAVGTERTAFRAGSRESKVSGQNAGPSLTLCEEDEALLSWKLTYTTEVIPRGLWSGLKDENCQHRLGFQSCLQLKNDIILVGLFNPLKPPDVK